MPNPYSREISELDREVVERARRVYPEIMADRADWEVIEMVSYLSI